MYSGLGFEISNFNDAVSVKEEAQTIKERRNSSVNRINLKQENLMNFDTGSSLGDEDFEDNSSQASECVHSEEDSVVCVDDAFIMKNTQLIRESHSINKTTMNSLLSEINDNINGKPVYYTSPGYILPKTEQTCVPKIEVSNFASDSVTPIDHRTLNEVAKLMNDDTKALPEVPVLTPKEEPEFVAPVTVKRPTAKRARAASRKASSKPKKTLKRNKGKMSRKDSSETKATEEDTEVVKATKKSGKIACQDCGKVFTAQGLGGHRAKAHPGQNPSYKEKMMIRRGNQHKREVLRFAQYLYYQRFPDRKILVKDIPRNIIQKLKTELEENPDMVEELRDIDVRGFLADKKKAVTQRSAQ